jgi:thiol-disulfide isomerase/thioredoxin
VTWSLSWRVASVVGMVVVVAAAAIALGLATLSAPPADDSVAAAVLRYEELLRSGEPSGDARTPERLGSAAADALSPLSVARLTIGHLSTLHEAGILRQLREPDPVVNQLKRLAGDPGIDGARAATIIMDLAWRLEPDQQADAIQLAAAHPGVPAALVQGIGAEVMSRLTRMDPAAIRTARPYLRALAEALPEDAQPATIWRADALVEAFADDPALEADRAAVWERVSAVAAAVKAEVAEDPDAESEYALLTRLEARLQSRYLRGQLIGHTSPEVEFLWYSGENEVRRLSDLRGYVVVLDFWATWCVPCIAQFPALEEFAARYRGYPARLVGLTSLQGRHIDGGITVRTGDDPDLEFNLMATYIQKRGLTWPVAFSSTTILDPDFGVDGIPHLVILDPAGRVRFAGGGSSLTQAQKYTLVDSLLIEFGHETPDEPY